MSQESTPSPSPGRKQFPVQQAKIVGIVVLSVLMIIVILQNTEPVETRLLMLDSHDS